ncbi:MAG: acyltransferase [Devosia sp.]
MTKPREVRFVALNALRGVAALAVVQRHGFAFLGGVPLPASYLAVDFFFLLSGFVLAHAYDCRLDNSMSTWEFMRARLLRLYPVYLLALLLAVVLAIATGSYPMAAFAAALLFLPDFWVSHFLWFIQPSWSLTWELIANLPFALFRRRLGPVLFILTAATALILLTLFAFARGSLDAGYYGPTAVGGLVRVFFSFPLGVILYRNRATIGAWSPRWATWPTIALLLLLLSLPTSPGLIALRDLAIVVVAFPTLLLFASRAAPRPATARIADALGDLSYPIYVLHAPLIGMVGSLCLAAGLSLERAPLPAGLAVLGGFMLLSWFVDRYVDRPIRRALYNSSAAQPVATLMAP